MDYKDLIAARHSVRRFTDQEVPRELVDTIIEEAITAPSSKNSKSTEFMVVEDPDTILALSEMRESGSAFMKAAKAAIVVLGDTTKTDLWEVNCAISTTFLQLSAVEHGLGSCWVHVRGRVRSKYADDPDPAVSAGHPKGTAEEYVKDLLGIRPEYNVLCVVALGYEAPKAE